MLSAKNIFLKNPIAIRVIPNLSAVSWIVMVRSLVDILLLEIFSRNCGRKWLALRMGPATNCGKNDTNKANSHTESLGFNCLTINIHGVRDSLKCVK